MPFYDVCGRRLSRRDDSVGSGGGRSALTGDARFARLPGCAGCLLAFTGP